MNLIARYINLDSSSDRRESLLNMVRESGLQIELSRFSGVQTADGVGRLSSSEYGCLLSHLSVVSGVRPGVNLMVLEDDVRLSPKFAEGIQFISKYLEPQGLDIVFLGQTILFDDVHTHKRLINLRKPETLSDGAPLNPVMLEGRRFYRWGAFAYVVSEGGVPKLRYMLDASARSESPAEVDRVFHTQIHAGNLKAGIVYPFVVGINSAHGSTMEDRPGGVFHALHARLVNIHCFGNPYSTGPLGLQVNNSTRSDPRALAIASSIYSRLVL